MQVLKTACYQSMHVCVFLLVCLPNTFSVVGYVQILVLLLLLVLVRGRPRLSCLSQGADRNKEHVLVGQSFCHKMIHYQDRTSVGFHLQHFSEMFMLLTCTTLWAHTVQKVFMHSPQSITQCVETVELKGLLLTGSRQTERERGGGGRWQTGQTR